MKRIALAAIAVSTLLMTGCIREDAVKIKEIDNISFSVRDGGKVNAVLVVENTTSHDIKIRDTNFTVTDMNGSRLAELWVDGEMYFLRKSETSVIVPLRVRLSNPVAGLMLMRDIGSLGDKVLVTGSARVKMGIVNRKIEFRDIPVSNIISNFDPEQPLKTPKIL